MEIRSEGSLLGKLETKRRCVEEGAVLQGTIDVHMPVEKAKPVTATKPAEALAEQDNDLALSQAS